MLVDLYAPGIDPGFVIAQTLPDWLDGLLDPVNLLLFTVAVIPLIAMYIIAKGKIGGEGGIGVRTVHKIVGTLLVPAIVILAVEGMLDDSAVTSFLGLILGYTLGQIAYSD